MHNTVVHNIDFRYDKNTYLFDCFIISGRVCWTLMFSRNFNTDK